MTARDRRPHEAPAPVLVRAKDAAVMLAISERLLWQMASRGEITRVLVGKKAVRYKVEEIRRFIEEHCDGGSEGRRARTATRASDERAHRPTAATSRAAPRARQRRAASREQNQHEGATGSAAPHGTFPDAGTGSPGPEHDPEKS